MVRAALHSDFVSQIGFGCFRSVSKSGRGVPLFSTLSSYVSLHDFVFPVALCFSVFVRHL